MESEIQIRDDHIHPQSCELICNIYNFMSKEAVLEEPSIPFRAVRKRVAQATAMPRSRIYRIISDLKRIRDGNPSHYIHKNGENRHL
ncbi:hypothetical protein HHI36_006522 [Cryptolaemus montrouzieri]|uniref:Uncharacterized protein n=1 Tax=Cryptolaemus montrouzieri TaxID=559131 RepID=A0ABD2NXN1_9CUCU